jgi:hypothetical protein
MHAVDDSVQKDTLTERRRSWFGRTRFIALVVLAVALAIAWLTGILDQRLDEWVDPPKSAGSPFVITTYPKVDPPADATPAQRLKCWCLTLKLAWGLRWRDPSQSRLLPQPVQQWPISYLLHQCMWASGTHYMIAKEVAGQTVSFGTTNTLDGVQWATAAEEALSRNGLLLIHVTPRLVQVIPEGKLDDYRKAGLVKTGDIKSSDGSPSQ